MADETVGGRRRKEDALYGTSRDQTGTMASTSGPEASNELVMMAKQISRLYCQFHHMYRTHRGQTLTAEKHNLDIKNIYEECKQIS